MYGRSACAAATISVLITAGCGSDSEPVTGTPTTPNLESAAPAAELLPSVTKQAAEPTRGATIVEMTGPPPRMVPTSFTVEAGDETVFFIDNTSPAGDNHGGHTLVIGPQVDKPLVVSDLVRAGQSATFTVSGLEPGRYALWCGFLNHASLGEIGQLRVR